MLIPGGVGAASDGAHVCNCFCFEGHNTKRETQGFTVGNRPISHFSAPLDSRIFLYLGAHCLPARPIVRVVCIHSLALT